MPAAVIRRSAASSVRALMPAQAIRPGTLLSWSQAGEWLDEQLTRYDIDPRTVVLELTEHGLGQFEHAPAECIAPLRRLGCDIAIDDLGTGVSGLQTWPAIRPEYVKVDRYLVAGIEADPVRGEILRAVIDMGHATSSHSIAEGIENRAQCAMVTELGVDYLQGFYIGRPSPKPQIEALASDESERRVLRTPMECAKQLARPIAPIASSTPIAEVVARSVPNRNARLSRWLRATGLLD